MGGETGCWDAPVCKTRPRRRRHGRQAEINGGDCREDATSAIWGDKERPRGLEPRSKKGDWNLQPGTSYKKRNWNLQPASTDEDEDIQLQPRQREEKIQPAAEQKKPTRPAWIRQAAIQRHSNPLPSATKRQGSPPPRPHRQRSTAGMSAAPLLLSHKHRQRKKI